MEIQLHKAVMQKAKAGMLFCYCIQISAKASFYSHCHRFIALYTHFRKDPEILQKGAHKINKS